MNLDTFKGDYTRAFRCDLQIFPLAEKDSIAVLYMYTIYSV